MNELVEDLGGGALLRLVFIPSGEFLMGAKDNPEAQPIHKVYVRGFFMGTFEVTRDQWLAVERLPKVNRKLKGIGNIKDGGDLPVDEISWADAREFCLRLSRHTGHSYRLATEAEWEYACRAGTTTKYSFGDIPMPELANFGFSEPRWRRIVGTSGPPNEFGLFDMHGNVAEWVEDVAHTNYVGAPADGNAWLKGGRKGERVNRGGRFAFKPESCECGARSYLDEKGFQTGLGFRVVRSLE